MKKISSVLIFILVFGLYSCQNKVKFDLQVNVVDNDGVSVKSAKILLNDEQVGLTDQAGQFKYSAEVKPGIKQLSVIKEDSKNNYSMHKEDLNISKSNREFNIDVKLYTVPKIDVSKRRFPVANAKDQNLIKEDDVSVDQQSLEESIPVKKEESSSVIYQQSPGNITIQENSQAALSKSFTVNVTNTSNAPVAGVTVSCKDQNEHYYVNSCTTNESGRCLLRYKGQDRSMDLLYQQEQYQTKIESVQVTDKKILEAKLSPGKTVDVLVFTSKLGKNTPEEASVLVNGKAAKKIGLGFYSYPFFNPKTKSISLSVKSPKGTQQLKVDMSKGSKLVKVNLSSDQKKN